MEIVVNPIGGLANRLRAIASGIALSYDRDVRIKEIVWPVNRDLYCRFDELFAPLAGGIKVRNVSALSDLLVYNPPRKKNLFCTPLFQKFRFSSTFFDLEDSSVERLFQLKGGRNPVLIRSGSEFYDFTSQMYRELFIPLPQFVEEAAGRLESADNVIGMHIRRTDNKESIARSPVELFVNKAREELDYYPDRRIYLATDDEPTKLLFAREFGSDRVIFSPSEADRTSEAGIKGALTELLCLSMCNKIYGSYWSSFSEAAALFGAKELECLALQNH